MQPYHTPFYSRWLGPAPQREERLATCGNCSMIAKGFRPELKCCTYFPYLPNFSIGAILAEGHEAQKIALRRALQQGSATPLGLFAPAEHERLKAELGEGAFGREPRLVCPFLAGHCTIWPFRPGVCASYFCQSEAPQLWKDIEVRVNLFEWTLAHEALWRLGFTADETRRMEELRAAGEHEGAWYEYQAKREELYRQAYAEALKVTPQEITQLMGDQ